ncbi:MAG: hypothetical protein JWQ69_2739 [Pseudomonas sp.]|nr:hypothetical protein [Pseudomonas sp.]
MRKIKPGKGRAGGEAGKGLAHAVSAYMVCAISGYAVGTNVVCTISGYAVGTDMVCTVSSYAVCTNVVCAVSSYAVCTDVVCTISSYAVCTDVVCAVSGDAGVVVMNQASICKSWNSESCASQYRERQAEDQFGSFHVSCSRSF